MTHQEFEERLDGIMQSNHTKGSHADDSNDREPCLCEAKQAIRELFEEYRTTITGKEGGE